MKTFDATIESQKILSCIVKTGQRFGARVISDTLRGKVNDRVRSLRFDRLSIFGIMESERKKVINEMIDELERMDYVRYVGAGYPIIKVTDAGWRVLRGEEKVMMTQTDLLRTSSKSQKSKEEETALEAHSRELFDALRKTRAEIAGKRGVPAYVIFSDAALRDMCEKMPKTDEEFLTVNGVGETKLKQYGAVFISVIKRYLPTKRGKLPFYISEEQLSHFEYSDTPIPISEITKRINDLAQDERRKKLRATDITDWLLSINVLKIEEANGKPFNLPTYDGTKLGLSVERREKDDGERYYITLYNRKAQEFVIDNLNGVIASL